MRKTLYVHCIDYAVYDTPQIGYEGRYTRIHNLHSEDVELVVYYCKHDKNYNYGEIMNAIMLYGQDTGEFSPSSLYHLPKKKPCRCRDKKPNSEGEIQKPLFD